jgi:BTB/POZ domain-containing protein 9
LWDCDDRSYSYIIKVSNNSIDWETIWDKTQEFCQSWQLIVFPMRPVVLIKIIGTHNTANEVKFSFMCLDTYFLKSLLILGNSLVFYLSKVFHCVHFECPAQCDEATIQNELCKLSQIVPVENSAEIVRFFSSIINYI